MLFYVALLRAQHVALERFEVRSFSVYYLLLESFWDATFGEKCELQYNRKRKTKLVRSNVVAYSS